MRWSESIRVKIHSFSFVGTISARIKSSKVLTRVLSGVFWVAAGGLIVRLLGMVSSAVIARVLGRELFGEFGIIRNTATTFMTFASLGLGLTATRYVAELRKTDPDRLWRIVVLSQQCAMALGVVVSGLVYWFSPVICDEMLNSPHLLNELRLSSFLIALLSVNGALQGALSGFEAFDRVARLTVFGTLVSVPLRIVLAIYFGVMGAVVSLIVEQVIYLVLGKRYLSTFFEGRSGERPRGFASAFQEYSVLLKFSIPAAISGLMVVPVRWYCNTVVAREHGFSEVGLFVAAISIQMIVLFVGTQINGPLLSIMSNLQGSASKQLQRFNMMASWISASFVVVVVLSFIELSEFLFGEDYAGRNFRVVLALLMISTSIMAYKQGLARLMAARNFMWLGFFSNLLWAVIIIICTRAFSKYGAVGLSLAYVISYAVNTAIILPVYFVKKLAPLESMMSKYTLAIWLVVIVQFVIVYFEFPLWIRMSQFLLAIGALAWAGLGVFDIKLSNIMNRKDY